MKVQPSLVSLALVTESTFCHVSSLQTAHAVSYMSGWKLFFSSSQILCLEVRLIPPA